MRVQAVVLTANFPKRTAVKWWATLEQARSAFGARANTVSITEGEWLEHWRKGLDPASAVIAELTTVD